MKDGQYTLKRLFNFVLAVLDQSCRLSPMHLPQASTWQVFLSGSLANPGTHVIGIGVHFIYTRQVPTRYDAEQSRPCHDATRHGYSLQHSTPHRHVTLFARRPTGCEVWPQGGPLVVQLGLPWWHAFMTLCCKHLLAQHLALLLVTYFQEHVVG